MGDASGTHAFGKLILFGEFSLQSFCLDFDLDSENLLGRLEF